MKNDRSTTATGWMVTSVFLLALLLRTAGLSHDLDAGRVYHPDTPKQVRATERFLEGEYYTILGGRDYEGYPYFNSHLVEYLVRVYVPVRAQIRHHLGLPDTPGQPHYLALFWITRLLNATLSALAVACITLIGIRFFSRRAGMLGGLLLALSPTDITAAHFATGDVTAAFFALLSVWCALEISRSARWRHYAGAGLLAAAAFSTKYHGGIALLATPLAHLTTRAACFPGAASSPVKRLRVRCGALPGWGRLAWCGCGLLAGILLTSPALLIYPESAFQDILDFLAYTSSFGMTAEMRAASFPQRFVMGMRVNMPVLFSVTGWVGVPLAVYACGHRRREAARWILLTVPMIYVLAGLATKPLTHPIYHTMATPYLFLLAAVALTEPLRTPSGRTTADFLLRGVLTLVAITGLGLSAQRELFFFRQNDTRYLSEVWVRDQVPETFAIHAGAYTFAPATNRTTDSTKGAVYVYSDRHPVVPPHGSVPATRFHFEDHKLIVFRNWLQTLHLKGDEVIGPALRRPGLQLVPSPYERNVIVADSLQWMRSDRMWDLTRHRPTRRGVVRTPQPLSQAVWQVRNGPQTSTLDIAMGRRRVRKQLAPHETAHIILDRPQPLRLFGVPHSYTRWRVTVRHGSARIQWLTDLREQAWAAFNNGAFDQAYTLFSAMPPDTRSSSDRLAFWFSASCSGQQEEVVSDRPLTLDWQQDYGVDRAFFRHLPGTKTVQDKLPIRATHEGKPFIPTGLPDHLPLGWLRDSGESPFTHYTETALTPLAPGHYTVRILLSGEPDALQAEWVDYADAVWKRQDLQRGTNEFQVVVDHSPASWRVRVRGEADALHLIRYIEVKPDLEATLSELEQLARTWRLLETPGEFPNQLPGALDKADVAFTSFTYAFWLTDAQHRAARGDHQGAARRYRRAIQAAPWRLHAYTQLARLVESGHVEASGFDTVLSLYNATAALRTKVPVSMQLRNGARLNGARLSALQVPAGSSFGIHLDWSDPPSAWWVDRLSAWVHMVEPGGRHPVFQGDRPLRTHLERALDVDRFVPRYIEVPVPEDTPAGRYDVRVGLWIPGQRRPVRVQTADTVHDRRGATITTIEVNEP